MRNIFIRPFTPHPIVISFKALIYLFLCLFYVKRFLIFADYESTRIMCTFQHKLIWQFFKIYIIKSIPHSYCWNNILSAYYICYTFFGSIFINVCRVFWTSIIQLCPLDLIIKALRSLQVQFSMHSKPKHELQIQFIRH